MNPTKKWPVTTALYHVSTAIAEINEQQEHNDPSLEKDVKSILLHVETSLIRLARSFDPKTKGVKQNEMSRLRKTRV